MKRMISALVVAAVALSSLVAAPLAQAAAPPTALPQADDEALRFCILARLAGMNPDSPTETFTATTDVTWFVMERARNEPDSGYVEAINSGLSKLRVDDVREIMAQAAVLNPLCAKRWPTSQRAKKVNLPSDGFDRAGICLSYASLLQGMAQAVKEPVMLAETKLIIDFNKNSLPDRVMIEHGFGGDDGAVRALAGWLRAGHALGNPASIVATCGALTPR